MAEGGGENQIRIAMRASDNEVQQVLEKSNKELEEMRAKMRAIKQESREAAKEAKDGFGGVDQAIGGLTDSLKAMGTALLGYFSVDSIKKFVDEIIKEQERLASAARQGGLNATTVLAQTGDLGNFAAIQQITRGTTSPLQNEADRLQVFKALRDAAPGLGSDQYQRLYELSLSQGARLYGGNAQATAGFAAGAAGISRIGGIDVAQAADVAAFVGAQQGGQEALPFGTQLAQMLQGMQPGLGGQDAMAQGLGLSLSLAQAGMTPRAGISAFSAYSSYLRTEAERRKRTFVAQGMSESAAASAAHSSVYGQGVASGFVAALGETDPARKQQMLGEGAVRLSAVSPEAYAANVAAVQGAGGYLRQQTGIIPQSVQEELRVLEEQAAAGMGLLEGAETSGRVNRQQSADLLRATGQQMLGDGLLGTLFTGTVSALETNAQWRGMATPFNPAGYAAERVARGFGAAIGDARPVQARDDRASGAPPYGVTVNVQLSDDGRVVDYSSSLDSMDVAP